MAEYRSGAQMKKEGLFVSIGSLLQSDLVSLVIYMHGPRSIILFFQILADAAWHSDWFTPGAMHTLLS